MTVETKYKIGQSLYFMQDNRVEYGHISKICIDIISNTLPPKISYHIDGRGIESENSEEVFETKEELIKSL